MKNIKGKSVSQMMATPSNKMYPCIWIDESDMPEVNTMKVGEEYELKIKVKITSKDEYADEKRTSVRMELLAYEDLTPKEDKDPSTPRTSTSDGFMPK